MWVLKDVKGLGWVQASCLQAAFAVLAGRVVCMGVVGQLFAALLHGLLQEGFLLLSLATAHARCLAHIVLGA